MEQLLRQEISGVINQIQRYEAPLCTEDEGTPQYNDTNEHLFSVVDARDDDTHFIKTFNEGAVHYINGKDNTVTYCLRFICYDEYLHRFTSDDGHGNAHKSRLKDGVKVADFLVYDMSDEKVYFIVQELSRENISNKRRAGKKQLSDTLNQLYKSNSIANLIDGFQTKVCYLSAKDDRRMEEPEQIEGFTKIYNILPEPVKFNFGQIGTHHFEAYETSIIILQ